MSKLQETLAALTAAEAEVGLVRASLAATLAAKDGWRPVYYMGLLEAGARDLLNKLDAFDVTVRAHLAEIGDAGLVVGTDSLQTAETVAQLSPEARAALIGTITLHDVETGETINVPEDQDRAAVEQDVKLDTQSQTGEVFDRSPPPTNPTDIVADLERGEADEMREFGTPGEDAVSGVDDTK